MRDSCNRFVSLDDVLRGGVACLIAAKPPKSSLLRPPERSFAAIRCAVIVAAYVLSGGAGEVVSLTERTAHHLS